MKKIIFLFCFFVAAKAFPQGKGYVINGTLRKAADNSYIYLTHKYNDVTYIDSAKISGEKFTFKGKTPEPNIYYITLRKIENPQLTFFVDNTTISINASIDSLASAHIKGGATEDDYKG